MKILLNRSAISVIRVQFIKIIIEIKLFLFRLSEYLHSVFRINQLYGCSDRIWSPLIVIFLCVRCNECD